MYIINLLIVNSLKPNTSLMEHIVYRTIKKAQKGWSKDLVYKNITII